MTYKERVLSILTFQLRGHSIFITLSLVVSNWDTGTDSGTYLQPPSCM